MSPAFIQKSSIVYVISKYISHLYLLTLDIISRIKTPEKLFLKNVKKNIYIYEL